MYTEKVMDHFTNPRNVGEIENPDGKGTVGNPVCGDIMQITIKVSDGRIEDVKFKTFGCGAAIATSSMVTEMVKGLPLDEAMKVSNRAVAEALGGLPPQKMHCSNLAADALHKAIEDYLSRNGKSDDQKKDQGEAKVSKDVERREGSRDTKDKERVGEEGIEVRRRALQVESTSPGCCGVVALANRAARDGAEKDTQSEA